MSLSCEKEGEVINDIDHQLEASFYFINKWIDDNINDDIASKKEKYEMKRLLNEIKSNLYKLNQTEI